MKKLILSVLVSCVMAAASLSHAQSQQSHYEIVILGDGVHESGAYGINSFGYPCGYQMSASGTPTPTLWSPDAYAWTLTPPAGASSTTGVAYSVNDYFDIGGTYGFWSGNIYHVGAGTATRWQLNASNDGFDPYSFGQAPSATRGINNRREICGWQSSQDIGFTANIFTSQGYNPQWSYTYCNSVNDLGNATGGTYASGPMLPIFAELVNSTYYTTVAPNVFGGGVAFGTHINVSNLVVGTTTYLGGFIWNPKTSATTFFGGTSACYGNNDLGTIVGVSNGVACMWVPKNAGGYAFTNLNGLTGNTNIVLETAWAINATGQIVGQCLNLSTGVRSAYMLTAAKPTPRALTLGTDGFATLSWPSVDGHDYVIRTSTNLLTWTTVPGIYVAEGTNSWVTFLPDQKNEFFAVFDLTP